MSKRKLPKLWGNFCADISEAQFKPLLNHIRMNPGAMSAKFGKTQSTLLLHLCAITPASGEESGVIIQCLEDLMEYDHEKKGLYRTDNQGNTAIHLAIQANHFELLKALLHHIDDLSHFRKVNENGQGPAAFARNLDQDGFAQLIEKHVLIHVLPDEKREDSVSFKDYIHFRQEELIQRGAVMLQNPEKEKGLISTIQSGIFRGDLQMDEWVYSDGLIALSHSAFIKPILELVALSIHGKHKENAAQYADSLMECSNGDDEDLILSQDIAVYMEENTSQTNKLKIFFFDIESTDEVFLSQPENLNSGGNYFMPNFTISLATRYKSRETLLATLIHEFCHCVAHIIYDNQCRPYALNEGENFEEVVMDLRERFTYVSSVHPNAAMETIMSVFRDYPEKQQAAELIVRVPEIIAILGHEQGILWLQQHTPRLLTYYENIFIKDINARLGYLEDKDKIIVSEASCSESGMNDVPPFDEVLYELKECFGWIENNHQDVSISMIHSFLEAPEEQQNVEGLLRCFDKIIKDRGEKNGALWIEQNIPSKTLALYRHACMPKSSMEHPFTAIKMDIPASTISSSSSGFDVPSGEILTDDSQPAVVGPKETLSPPSTVPLEDPPRSSSLLTSSFCFFSTAVVPVILIGTAYVVSEYSANKH